MNCGTARETLLASRTFHRWELEFRMRALYLEAYLGRGSAHFDRGDFKGALKDFEQALECPENPLGSHCLPLTSLSTPPLSPSSSWARLSSGHPP